MPRRLSLGQLRDKCAKVIADADPDPEGRHARLRRQRRGRRYSTPDGFHHLHLQSTPEDLADVDVTLNAIVDELFKAAAREGDARPARPTSPMRSSRWRAERRGAHGCKPSPTYTAVIRADLTALVNGRVGAGEMCEIAGIGPVPVGVVRQLLGDAV